MKSVLAVRVSAAASRSAVLGWHGSELKVAVRATPERGRANEEVQELISQALGLRRGEVRLVSGATSRRKKFEVTLDMEDMLHRLGKPGGYDL